MKGEIDLFVRPGGDEIRGQPGHIVHAQRPQQTQPDQAVALGAPVEIVHALVQNFQGLFHAFQKPFAEYSQLHIPVSLLKQGDAQLPLQLGNGMAQAGLGDIQLFRRPGEVPGMGQLDEISQMGQIHKIPSFRHSSLCQFYHNAWFDYSTENRGNL